MREIATPGNTVSPRCFCFSSWRCCEWHSRRLSNILSQVGSPSIWPGVAYASKVVKFVPARFFVLKSREVQKSGCRIDFCSSDQGDQDQVTQLRMSSKFPLSGGSLLKICQGTTVDSPVLQVSKSWIILKDPKLLRNSRQPIPFSDGQY